MSHTGIGIDRRRERWLAALPLVGGLAVVAGVFIPWLSLLAGLEVLNGARSLNGRILLAGGAALTMAGIVASIHPSRGVVRTAAWA